MEQKRLGDIATYINGYPFKPEERGTEGLPIVRIQDLTGNTNNLGFYHGDYPKRIEINDGDVLISWSASLGVYIWNRGKALLNQHIFKVVFDKVSVDKQYFVYAVQHKLKEMESKTHGATMKHIVKKDFDNTMIPFPSLQQQAEIAGILSKVEGIIKARQKELSEFDYLIKARFVEMFGTVDHNIYGFPIDTFDNISKELFAGGDKPSDCVQYMDADHPYPVYANGYEREGLQGYSATNRVNQASVTVSARETIGYCFVRNAGFTPTVRLITVVPNSRVSVVYIKYAIDTMDIIGSGSSQAQLTVPEFRNTRILVPPFGLQEKFVRFVAQIERSTSFINNSLNESQLIFNSLMKEYFDRW